MNSDSKTLKPFTVELPEIIKSKVKTLGPPRYAFRGYKYTTIKAKIIENGLPQDICLDTGSISAGEDHVIGKGNTGLGNWEQCSLL
ncbi:hypothetical protein GcC1_182054 [Golovinomyces cichoracearum]|uniref:Uncharacterized protein n=1 Tax=Golovinomyces cichoracearum TaxID=62708 RepID=A0A420HLY4_9PEZI|nr:hypothetical protein GcC1_182054 [Golovinomyces cichoracearum]